MNCPTCNNMSPHVHEPALVADIDRLKIQIGELERQLEETRKATEMSISDLQGQRDLNFANKKYAEKLFVEEREQKEAALRLIESMKKALVFIGTADPCDVKESFWKMRAAANDALQQQTEKRVVSSKFPELDPAMKIGAPCRGCHRPPMACECPPVGSDGLGLGVE